MDTIIKSFLSEPSKLPIIGNLSAIDDINKINTHTFESLLMK